MLVHTRGRLLLVAWLSALGIVGLGVVKVRIETDVIEWFQRSDPVRVSYEQIRTKLSGISPMNVVLETDDRSSTVRADVLVAIDRLSSDLQNLPEVGKVISIADPIRQIHGGFQGDDSNPLPMDDALIEQYLLLLESKPYVRDLVTPDRAVSNVVLRVDDNGSDALLRVAGEARGRWSEYGPEGVSATVTGIMYEFARAEDEIARGQIAGLAIAISAIGIVLVAIFRSVRLAFFALVTNAIPVCMAFGLMGLVGIPLDAGTVILGSLVLGIAVDDTVHVSEGFVMARLRGEEPREALALGFSRVIKPVVYTTVVVASGFLVLTLSDFTLTRNLGLLTAGAMFLCLATDLLLLPVLLLHSDLEFGGSKPD